MFEAAGPLWCARFLCSASLEDLIEPFQSNVKALVQAMRIAGATVTIEDTYRPKERAYLMHWCCLIAGYRDHEQVFHQISPSDVPPMTGVDIDWTCGGDAGAARSAAAAMRKAYKIVYPAALESRHTQRTALDMGIHIPGVIHVRTKTGTLVPVERLEDLFPVGKSYGVIKLVSDPPHWSIDGR